jgi:ribokinase
MIIPTRLRTGGGILPRKPRIVVFGSSNTDMIVRTARLPRPGETVIGGTFHTAAGGKGANQAVAAARAGGDVTFVARVGNDPFGRQAVAGFRRDGIDTRFVEIDRSAPSGVAFILVDHRGQNSIAVASGANANLSAEDAAAVRKRITASDLVLLQLEVPLPAIRAAAEIAGSANVPVLLNPAPARRLDAALLRRISILTPNESEAEALAGIALRTDVNIGRAAARLIQKGVSSVVITLGERGAYYDDGSDGGFLPGFKVKAVDSTAAGDVFSATLAVAVAEGKPLPGAVVFANAAAALSVTRLGAQHSAPSREKIECFLKKERIRS